MFMEVSVMPVRLGIPFISSRLPSSTFYKLVGPLYRYNSAFRGMDDTAYKAAAAKIAKPLIADFVAMLTDDILLNGKAPDIPKIAIWQTDVGDNGNVIEQIYSGGVDSQPTYN
jgi:hypothetical protein